MNWTLVNPVCHSNNTQDGQDKSERKNGNQSEKKQKENKPLKTRCGLLCGLWLVMWFDAKQMLLQFAKHNSVCVVGVCVVVMGMHQYNVGG